MKKRTKKKILRGISGGLAALFLIGIGILGLVGLSSLQVKACDFTLVRRENGRLFEAQMGWFMSGLSEF